MSVDKLPVFENFPPGKGQNRLVLWIEKMYRSISRRINFLLSLLNSGFVEIPADDVDPGTDGNWRWRVSGSDLVLQRLISGTWTDTGFKVFTTDVVRMGNVDGSDFTEVEADGTVVFKGSATVWKDINIGAATLSGPPGLQPGIVNFVDNLGADTGIATFGLAVGEGFSGQFEMQHDYKEGSDIVFHVHYQGIAAPTGTDKIQFQLTYTFGNFGVTLAPVTVITVEVDIDTQYEFNVAAFAAITGTDIDIMDQFLFTFERIAASGDEYGGEALIATVGVHYEIDTIGSRQILTK